MIDIDHAAHWAELISAIISSGAVLPTCWRVWKLIGRLMRSLHDHKEQTGTLEAKGIVRVFVKARAGD